MQSLCTSDPSARGRACVPTLIRLLLLKAQRGESFLSFPICGVVTASESLILSLKSSHLLFLSLSLHSSIFPLSYVISHLICRFISLTISFLSPSLNSNSLTRSTLLMFSLSQSRLCLLRYFTSDSFGSHLSTFHFCIFSSHISPHLFFCLTIFRLAVSHNTHLIPHLLLRLSSFISFPRKLIQTSAILITRRMNLNE